MKCDGKKSVVGTCVLVFMNAIELRHLRRTLRKAISELNVFYSAPRENKLFSMKTDIGTDEKNPSYRILFLAR